MSSEKNLKQQRKAFRDLIKDLISIEKSSAPFDKKELYLRLPQIPDMNEENIKPALEAALGYVPEITLFQKTTMFVNGTCLPIVLVVLKIE